MTPRRTMRRSAAAALAGVTGLLLAASCTTDTAEEPEAAERESELGEQCRDAVIPELPELEPVAEGTGTRTVATDFGDVDLPAAPEAALGMYTTDVDMLIWLRYPLAASQPIRSDSGYTTFPCFFPQEALADVSTFTNYPEYDYESLLLAEPDFILNGLGYDPDVVSRLPEIAPTYSVDAFDGESWMLHFEQTAAALGRSQYYEEWKAIYDERVAEVRALIEDPAAITVAPVGYWEDQFQTGCYSGVECQVFEDLGLTVAPTSLANDREGEALSGETIGKMDGIDYAFMIRGIGDEGDAQFQQLLDDAAENPLWADLDFVAQDGVVGYEMEMTFGSPSGQLAFLDVVEQALVG
ncbi:ABC transporter substrate-binding protein [Glycomyces harbinensis]|uniref:Iron complex transport system substrate-binding protein n=1 Tax=Glycomyces harbinensis TaxID=58114 RepID=A0A1G6QX00_9ACTN|nr:ABC transporter substrate-binding protein [Glycomyces harbinensis]SDC96801.1 iron complex transport system substrate-binding protein [Glycomyces harbinensis]